MIEVEALNDEDILFVTGKTLKTLEVILMEPDKIMEKLSKELDFALQAMAKAKDLNERESYSRIVRNMCESLGVFFSLASDIMPFDEDEFDEDEFEDE